MAQAKNASAPDASGNVELGNPGAPYDAGNVDTGSDDAPSTIAGIPVTKPGGTNPAADAPRKRGRPAGSTSKSSTREKAAPTTLKGIEKILFSLHAGMAGLTGIEELKIDREESAAMTEAIAEVASHYSVAVDPKVMAWIGFAGAMGTIYGPRVASWRMRKSLEKKSDKSRPLNVVPMPAATSGLVNGFPLPGATG